MVGVALELECAVIGPVTMQIHAELLKKKKKKEEEEKKGTILCQFFRN